MLTFLIVENVLLPPEREYLIRTYRNAEGYEPGRQETGYEKLNVVGDEKLQSLIRHSVRRLHPAQPRGDVELTVDAWVLRYREGSFIPPHRDPSPGEGFVHARMNYMLLEPDEGGELYVEGRLEKMHFHYAYLFRPDLLEHEMKPITKGMRLVFSVGVVYREKDFQGV